MAQLSTARKLSILARVAVNSAGRNRTVGAAMNAAKVTGNHLRRVVGVLWLEVMGFIFLGVATIAAFAAIREYHRYQMGQMGINRAVLALAIALMFTWFGVSSFWRVKKKK